MHQIYHEGLMHQMYQECLLIKNAFITVYLTCIQIDVQFLISDCRVRCLLHVLERDLLAKEACLADYVEQRQVQV